MIAYIIEIPKNQNWIMFNSVSLTNQSQITKLNSGLISSCRVCIAKLPLPNITSTVWTSRTEKQQIP